MRGVPLRLELGPKDIEKSQCVLVRRDTREKIFTPLEGLGALVSGLLEKMQGELLDRARRFVSENTTRVSSYDEFKQVMADKRGFIVAGWNGDAAVEAQIKAETKATIRVIPMGEPREAACVVTGQKGREVVFAQAY
jgi:prolyl-tRNA synthetase